MILIVTTQTWLQVTRLAVRFSHHGCRVSALCPPESELRFYERLHSFHVLRPRRPLRSLEKAIARSGADYLVPGDDLAVWLLQELGERSPQHKCLVERSIGPCRSFATVRSRHGLLALAATLGIEVPETVPARRPQDAEAWSRASAQKPAQNSGLPFLLKKDGTWGGGGVEIVTDLAALPHHYARLEARPPLLDRMKQKLPASKALVMPASWISDPEVSAQRYVEGVAANAMFACDRGRILGTVQAHVIAARGKTGPALMIGLVKDERIERAGRLLADSLQLSGFFGLDFILEKTTGTPVLIEMNPRCTQMGHFALSDQADLAGLLWARWTGAPPPSVDGRELASSICFYPQTAAQFHAGSGNNFRMDVCEQDRATVDRLARGNPAPLARAYQAARARLRHLKHSLNPPQPSPVYYFLPVAGARRPARETGSFAGDCPGYPGMSAAR